MIDVIERFWVLGGERFDLGTAALVRHRDGHPLGTFLSAVRADSVEGTDALLARADELVDGGCRHVRMDADTPPAVEAALVMAGWTPEHQLQLVLPADLAVEPARHPPRPVRDDDWPQIEALFRLDHLEEDARAGRPARPTAATAAAIALRRALTPAVGYFAVERAGELVAVIAAWAGDGTGVIEDVFVRADARGAGVATDLLRFAVGHARTAGAGPVMIGADPDDTVKQLYARFGFRPTAVTRGWIR
jgi:GNAT superfamily N-acetyltransferase